MYVADERFKKNIDKHVDGTAEFVREAIGFYCGRQVGQIFIKQQVSFGANLEYNISTKGKVKLRLNFIDEQHIIILNRDAILGRVPAI